jgi:hypothetical protein
MKDDFQAHGYNEAFTIAPNLGVGHFSVPIKLSPGRDGFHPELALSHGSAASNGDFGLGWSIDIPHISRRTSQGVPTYDDEQDVFVYSLDELTPKLDDHGAAVTSTQDGYCQTEFVPQVAHSPVRIERFISVNDCNDSFWRVTTANNVTHTFGSEPSSQIYDAALFAKSGLKQVFAWLLDYSYDARGNAILYNYASETTDGIDASAPFEQNRSSEMISSYRHPIGIKYGNIIPNRDLETWSVCRRSQLDQTRGWLFEIAFDYGQFPLDVSPTTQVLTPTGGASAWACRPDPFSSHRCGFELRNNRLCDRILMFHHFPDEFGQEDLLVSATVLNYQLVNGASTLQSLRHTGYLTDPSDSTKFVQSSLPPMCFEYADSVLTADPEIKTMPGNHFAQSPVQLVDVNGDGSLGLFAQHADSWYYQPSSGAESSFEDNAWVPISEIPGHLAHDGQLDDIDGDGLVNLTRLQGPTGGFYGRSNQGAWQSFQAFENQIHLPDGGGYSLLRQMDLTGDGLPDLLCAANDFIVWYKSLGQQGHGESRYCFVGVDEVSGPRSVVQSSSEAIFVADMTGDGLLDLVRVSHSAVCYWPSQGHGRFGHQVIMGNSPLLGSYDLFSPHRVILSNISGNGCADLVYFSADGDRSWASVCYNIAGNTWSDLVDINGIPAMDNSTEFFVADLFGGQDLSSGSLPNPAKFSTST